MRVTTPMRTTLWLALSQLAAGCTYNDWVNPWHDAGSDAAIDAATDVADGASIDVGAESAVDAAVDARVDVGAEAAIDAAADAPLEVLGGSEHVRIDGCGGVVGNGIALRNTWVLTAASALGGSGCTAAMVSVTATPPTRGASLQRTRAVALWRNEALGVALIQLESPLRLLGGDGDFGFARELSADSAATVSGASLSCSSFDGDSVTRFAARASRGVGVGSLRLTADLDGGVATSPAGIACLTEAGSVAAITTARDGSSALDAVASGDIRTWAEDAMQTAVGGGEEPAADSLPSVVATADGRRLDALIRDQSNRLRHRTMTDGRWTSPSWDSPFPLLSVRSNPALVGKNFASLYHLVVVTLDPDSRLWVVYQSGSSWSGPENGDFYGDPRHAALPALTTTGLDRVDMMAVRMNGQLVHNHHDSGRWANWESATGGFRLSTITVASGARPAFVASLDHLDLVVRGTDGHLYADAYRAPAGWGTVVDLEGASSSDPTAVSPGRDRLDVVVRGEDNTLRAIHLVDGAWSEWETVPGGPTLAGQPAAVSRRAGVTHVYARGRDGALWSVAREGSTWRPWRRLGGAVISDPVVAPSTRGNEVFVIAADHTLRMHTH